MDGKSQQQSSMVQDSESRGREYPPWSCRYKISTLIWHPTGTSPEPCSESTSGPQRRSRSRASKVRTPSQRPSTRKIPTDICIPPVPTLCVELRILPSPVKGQSFIIDCKWPEACASAVNLTKVQTQVILISVTQTLVRLPPLATPKTAAQFIRTNLQAKPQSTKLLVFRTFKTSEYHRHVPRAPWTRTRFATSLPSWAWANWATTSYCLPRPMFT
jgi:hypothetical protein